MVLKAQQSRLPFILLAIIVVIPIGVHLWMFVRAADFSMHAFLPLLETFGVLFILGSFLNIHFKIVQSVELTDEGVWYLVLKKPTKTKLLPRLEKDLLKWGDIKKWAITTHLIYLYGHQHKIVINTLLFKEAQEVVKFINNATKANII